TISRQLGTLSQAEKDDLVQTLDREVGVDYFRLLVSRIEAVMLDPSRQQTIGELVNSRAMRALQTLTGKHDQNDAVALFGHLAQSRSELSRRNCNFRFHKNLLGSLVSRPESISPRTC